MRYPTQTPTEDRMLDAKIPTPLTYDEVRASLRAALIRCIEKGCITDELVVTAARERDFICVVDALQHVPSPTKLILVLVLAEDMDGEFLLIIIRAITALQIQEKFAAGILRQAERLELPEGGMRSIVA